MRYKALNVGTNVNYWQGNNIFEIIDGPAYNWCNTESLSAARAALIPYPDKNRNPYGGTYECQEGDYLAMYFRNSKNDSKFKSIRNLPYNYGYKEIKGKFRPERVPQLHPAAMKDVFNLDSKFTFNSSFDKIVAEIKKGNVVEICLKEPGHYVLANQYDDLIDKISFKDPAKDVVKWLSETLDKDGNKWFNRKNYLNNIHKWHVVIYKPE